MTTVTLRPYNPNDTKRLAHIYTQAALILGKTQYTEQQVQMWADYPVQYFDEFTTMLSNGDTYVAISDCGEILGFGQLCPTDYVTLLYVLPEYSRAGVGTTIYKQLENITQEDKQKCVSVTASKISKGLFEKLGFEVIDTEISLRNGIEFERYNMVKIFI
ncbi:GNAT family N-acetyltransferase [Photobacterium profundum]|uniref:GNAT family N-acetyltransferase n=1 Tax=Photobacterium profundum TaxID=74109 RepID=UPI0002F43AC3|nr:GNAT family N-acetyltransferase [Photobacterium profundum]